MDLKDFLDYVNSGKEVESPSEVQEMFDELLLEATKIKSRLNCEYHTEDEIREIFAELTSQPVNETLMLIPPFHTDCGKNIHIGENVFINSNCTMQDQGGIYIADDVLIGHNACLLTLNHNENPELVMEPLLQQEQSSPRMWAKTPLLQAYLQKLSEK